MERVNACGMPVVARWRTLPLERKLPWILRLGVVGCFLGHGAYSVLTKEAWVPYFGVVGIDRAAAARELAQVLRPQGRLVAAVWAGPEACDIVLF